MTDEKQHSDGQLAELKVDIEGLLAAIQARTSGEMRDWMEQDQAPRLDVEDRVSRSCSELAAAFEIDICNYRVSEASR